MTDLPSAKLSRLVPLAAASLVALAVSFTAAAQIARGATPGATGMPTLGTALAETRDAVSAALRAPCWTPCHLNEIVLDHARARLAD